MCLGKYHTFSNKSSLRFDKLMDQRTISGWLNKSPIRLFPDQQAGILLFLYIDSQFFRSGSGTRISEVIESKYRRETPFPQNSVRMANFSGWNGARIKRDHHCIENIITWRKLEPRHPLFSLESSLVFPTDTNPSWDLNGKNMLCRTPSSCKGDHILEL